ncbi:SulP family inorganic anion transporter [Eubacterium album]|jgi:SulP family sulfate permease|uniref:SulP family inorganic anion transporter n=1 Tax=Eubacterium album TaxID=2978477 RepID=A0ABT2M261_9FIRM|nr:SulP family inorganic anion transporter [Eubacterium sp. LFL-14]MCT7398732.1 SulP family inorganic anion transporter [Eubacterium sp. LFL-14]
MKIKLLHTLKNYDRKNLIKDIIAGIIIMAVSIPISMGYAQIAGLPAVYGIYGSVFPILAFALFSTSPQFIFGVDAAPAALVGSALLSLNIELGSDEAIAAVPVMTFFVAVWLLAFYFMKAGKLVNYISAPVMGGFITGICTTIILMQIPKIMGGSSGTGEFFELAEHIYETLKHANIPSVIMGVIALVILLVSKKLIPKFPMAVVLMFAGTIITLNMPIRDWGINTLSAVEPGLPKWSIPDFSIISIQQTITISLSVAVVIMAETLLAENSFAQKNNYRINDNQEILAFSVGNFMAAFTGCCPINGSVSRTAMGEQYQAKTQLTGIVAGLSMIVLLICGTGFIGYLPIPILTAIVISALLGATEFDLAARLWKLSRTEFLIFVGAFLGVLLLGTINGVLIGIILSFTEMIIRTSKPSRCFLGIQPGHRHFRDLKEGNQIHAIEGVIIYRFSSNLFFANIGVLQRDIEDSIKPDTKAVILDASGIGSIDITAADRLAMLYKSLKEKGIRFYMTEHIAKVNEQIRTLGLGYMIEEGRVRRTIHIALKDMGIARPYPLEGGIENEERSASRKRADNKVQEFVWAFGAESEEQIEKQIVLQIQQLKKTGDIEKLFHGSWSHMDAFDEDEWLEHLEEHLKEIVNISGKDEKSIATRFEEHRKEIHERIKNEHPEMAERFKKRRHILDEHLRQRHPEVFNLIEHLRESDDSN